MDFGEDLNPFISASPSNTVSSHSAMSSGTSNERSTTGGSPDDGYRPHNIFDMSAGGAGGGGSSSATSASFPQNFQRPSHPSTHDGSPGSFSGSPHEHGLHGHQQHLGFYNSTLPALNSSMRYEPQPDPPPSSYNFNHRGTPSPATGNDNHSRSRSRSRPPSAGAGGGGGVGPQRTTRTRRNNSVSSTSPPPHGHGHWNMNSIGMMNGMNMNGAMNGAFGNMGGPMNHRPASIVIPRGNTHNGPSAGTPVSPLTGSTTSSGWDFASLPTPDSVHGHSHLQNVPPLPSIHHHGHGHPGHQGGAAHPSPHYGSMPSNYGAYGMGMSPPELPPVSSLGGLGTPTSLTSPGLSTSPPSSVAPQLSSQPDKGSDKQTLLASEKRRRRRESHNAVERRRRDNINEKISELATLIPVGMLEGATNEKGGTNGLISIPINPQNPQGPSAANLEGLSMSPVDDAVWKEGSPGAAPKKEDTGAADLGGSSSGEAGGVVKANKGMILRKSVEYIKYLQQLVNAQGSRNRELEDELRGYRATGVVPVSTNGTNGGAAGHGGGPGARTPTPGDMGMSFSMANYGMDKFPGMFGLENLNENEEDNDDDDVEDCSMDVEDEGESRRGRKEKRNGAASKACPAEDKAKENGTGLEADEKDMKMEV